MKRKEYCYILTLVDNDNALEILTANCFFSFAALTVIIQRII